MPSTNYVFPAVAAFALFVLPAAGQQSIAEIVAQLKADVASLQHGLPAATSSAAPLAFSNVDFGSGFANFKNAGGTGIATIGKGSDGSGGLWIRSSTGKQVLQVSALTGTSRGYFELDSDGNKTITLGTQENGSGIGRFLAANGNHLAVMGGSSEGKGGAAWFYDASGKNLVFLGAGSSGRARVSLKNPSGTEVATLDDVGGGALILYNASGKPVVRLAVTTTESGAAYFFNAAGDQVASIGPLSSDESKGFLYVKGNDFAELFDVAEKTPASTLSPGSVVAASPDGNGIVLARTPCDPTVIGVLSGAGALHPAMVVGSTSDATTPPVAVAGQVYVRVSTESGSIQVGDLLVSSSTPGVAMRAADPAKMVGAIIGKALQTFSANREGYVRMLVLNR